MAKKERIDYNVKTVEMIEIVKKFGDFVANDGINLTVHKGEIHAILGENGAGKSTLMNQLYGLFPPTSGEIRINGKPLQTGSTRRAIEAGIGMVHQHFMLIEPFTVTENIVLGEEPLKDGIILDMKKARQDVVDISARYGLDIDPDAKIEDISVGMQQRVEILKALYHGAEILILDEPTASLTPQEIDELIEIMHSLTADGKSIILITHKLKEIKAAADYCTIIRMGRMIGTVDVDDVNESELAGMMVGRNVTFVVDKPEQEPGEPVLEIENLHGIDYRKVEILRGLSLTVHRGEILGVAGIDGNGQTEMVEIITGLRKATSGSIRINGTEICNRSPRFGFMHGVSSIPADRQKHGLVLDFSVAENMILQNFREPQFQSHGIINRDAVRKYTEDAVEKYDIRPRDCVARPAGTLSGGNQQKVIVAREVNNDKDLLIAVNPTRGLDVGAIEYVHRYIVEQRNKGKAVLLVSFELDEVMSLSDRIAVIHSGQIVGTVDGKNADEKQLGFMMAGGVKHD